MGVYREDGYSASVSGYLLVGSRTIQLAKTNGRTLVVAEQCDLAAGTVGQLLITVDGKSDCLSVELPDGIVAGQTTVRYSVIAPF
ncbi:MAG TPA: hypothetical protein VMF30_08555 [Pirellulales bacterium]|nr:hypothetical protein [Pirellulales bacterium]